MGGLHAEGLKKYFGDTRAVDEVSFHVSPGEIFAVLGPSGCGKSTLLELIAGLITPQAGEVRWGDRALTGIPPHRRGFGLMFQDLALFPHMDVQENVSFGLRMRGLREEQVAARVREVLELVDMDDFAYREVTNLSGGEQQRVALARALAPEPRLLMLDEPLGSLDRALRERLMIELYRILKDIGQTAIYVTHDQEEAFALADRLAIMRAGQFLRVDEPQEIYRRPETLFVARFLGMKNILQGQVVSADGRAMARTDLGEVPIPEVQEEAVHVLLRPDAAVIGGDGEVKLEGRVLERSFRGGSYRTMVEVTGQELSFDFPSRARVPEAGESIELTVDPGGGVQLLEEG